MHRRTFCRTCGILAAGLAGGGCAGTTLLPRSDPMPLHVRVESEQPIYSFTPANNGAGPLWCHGSTIVARRGERVFVAGLETLPDHEPLNNCCWVLYASAGNGWELVHRDDTGRTREPSPIALLDRGDLLVSANPTLAEPRKGGGPAEPCVFRFHVDNLAQPPARELPVWQGEPAFTEHSYRTVTADGPRNEVLYMQNVGYDVAHMSFLGCAGQWQGVGTLAWPHGAEYDPPRPLRLCYPNVMLRDRAVHFFGVGDIVEPVEEWRRAKFEITQREWDYVFRRLYYAYTPDITSEPFGPWIEVANLDATAGAMRNGDIYLDESGTAHLIWCETSVDPRLRDRVFPGEQVLHTLEYMALRNGQQVDRATLSRADEGEDVPRPAGARFHVLEDATLLALASFAPNVEDSAQPPVAYRMAALSSRSTESPAGETAEWVDIPFQQCMPGTFLTNTVRGGSAPSSTIDLVGMRPGAPPTLGYARVRVERG